MKQRQFPNCLGALDGKDNIMQSPTHSGSHFRNYKGTNSVELMTLADADLQFLSSLDG